MINGLLAKVLSSTNFTDGSHGAPRRCVRIGVEHLDGSMDEVLFDVNEAEEASFRERMGKTVCLVIEDA